MKTQTGYYGETEYNPSDLIVVAEGFFGFPELKQFLPLRLDEDNDSLLLMQSVENSQVAFVVIAPTILCPDYSPVLTEEDLSALDTEDCNELSYYAVCVIKDNYLEDTVNLKCPLAINPKTKAARQVILENTDYGYRHKLNTFSSITKKHRTGVTAMLILHRKTNESILIGDHIRITVIETSSMGVRLAIDAPKDIKIMREELAIAAKTNEASLLPSIRSIHSLQEILEQHRKEVRE